MSTYIADTNYIEMSAYMNSLYLYYHHFKILFLNFSPLIYNYDFFFSHMYFYICFKTTSAVSCLGPFLSQPVMILTSNWGIFSDLTLNDICYY